jgi:hypothetical protein
MSVPNPPFQASERDTLAAFLDYNRAVMLDKAGGLTTEQLRTAHPPSTLTIVGLIYHLALVEDDWFLSDFAGKDLGEPWSTLDWENDPDVEFSHAATIDPDDAITACREAIDRSNRIVAEAESLDQLSVRPHPRTGEHYSLRWIIAHMIEETARHAGHADFIRESIDGQTGDFQAES